MNRLKFDYTTSITTRTEVLMSTFIMIQIFQKLINGMFSRIPVQIL